MTPSDAAPRPGGQLRELGDRMADIAERLLDRGVGLDEALQAFEARYVSAAVERNDGNLSQAAAALGIHRNTLRLKLKRIGRGGSRREP